jgi:hypothetical protein
MGAFGIGLRFDFGFERPAFAALRFAFGAAARLRDALRARTFLPAAFFALRFLPARFLEALAMAFPRNRKQTPFARA